MAVLQSNFIYKSRQQAGLGQRARVLQPPNLEDNYLWLQLLGKIRTDSHNGDVVFLTDGKKFRGSVGAFM